MEELPKFTAQLNGPLIAALAATAAALSASYFAFINFRREQTNQAIAYLGMKQRYFEDLRKWAEGLTDLLSEAVHLCELNPTRVRGETFFDRRHRLRTALSSMIDQGRWFFPNVNSEDHGKDKPSAFRGYRHEVLDSLVDAYREMNRVNYRIAGKNDGCRETLVNAKREFVSQIQEILDPARRSDEFTNITKTMSRNFKRAKKLN